MKNKNVATLLAFLLGSFGVHKFYLGQTRLGILYLIFSWTYIPWIIAFINCIKLLLMDNHIFDLKYNTEYITTTMPHRIVTPNIVVTVPEGSPSTAYQAPEIDVIGQLEKLNDLRVSGTITAEEFKLQKARILQHPSFCSPSRLEFSCRVVALSPH